MRIKKHLSIDEWKRTHRNYLEEYTTDLSNHVCRIIGRIIDWNINIDSMKLFALYRRVRTVILLFSWQLIIKLYRSSRACREIASRIGLEFLCSSYCYVAQSPGKFDLCFFPRNDLLCVSLSLSSIRSNSFFFFSRETIFIPENRSTKSFEYITRCFRPKQTRWLPHENRTIKLRKF